MAGGQNTPARALHGPRIIIEAVPIAIYTDRETGEELEVVARSCRCAIASRLPWAIENRASAVCDQLAQPTSRLPDLRASHGRWRLIRSTPLHMRTYVLALSPSHRGPERLRTTSRPRRGPLDGARPDGPAGLRCPGQQSGSSSTSSGSTSTDQSATTSTDQTRPGQPHPGRHRDGPGDPAAVHAGRNVTGHGGALGRPRRHDDRLGRHGGVSGGEFSQFCKDNPGAC